MPQIRLDEDQESPGAHEITYLPQKTWIVKNSRVHKAGVNEVKISVLIWHIIGVDVPDFESREG